MSTKKTHELLKIAADLTAGDRAKTHGDKEPNFSYAAALQTALLSRKLKPGETITAAEAALMLAMHKISRMPFGTINQDDFIDGAAYVAIAGELSLQANAR